MSPDTASVDTGEIDMKKAGPTDKGRHRLETRINGGHGSDGPSHGESGEPESPGIHLGLLLKEGKGTASSHREEKPVGIAWAGNRINGEFIGLQGAFPTFPQGFRIKARSLGGIDLSPIGSPFVFRIKISLKRTPEPIDIEGRETLGRKVVSSFSIGTLSPAMTPNKGGVLLSVLREAIVSSHASIAPLEGPHFKCHETGDDTVLLPLMMNFDLESLSFGIVALPELGCRLGDLFRGGEWGESVLGRERKGAKNRKQKERDSGSNHTFIYVWKGPNVQASFIDDEDLIPSDRPLPD